MIEAGLVIAKNGAPLHWHLPPGRSGGFIPDTRSLWDVLWEQRGNVEGFAHSHPGSGIPGPSDTDLTTFQAIESALGRRLDWWITSDDRLVHIRWYTGSGMYTSTTVPVAEEPTWVAWLRRLSREEATQLPVASPDDQLSYLIRQIQQNCTTHQYWNAIGWTQSLLGALLERFDTYRT